MAYNKTRYGGVKGVGAHWVSFYPSGPCSFQAAMTTSHKVLKIAPAPTPPSTFNENNRIHCVDMGVAGGGDESLHIWKRIICVFNESDTPFITSLYLFRWTNMFPHKVMTILKLWISRVVDTRLF